MGVIQQGINQGLALTALGIQNDPNLKERAETNINKEKARKLNIEASKIDVGTSYSDALNAMPTENNVVVGGDLSKQERENLGMGENDVAPAGVKHKPLTDNTGKYTQEFYNANTERLQLNKQLSNGLRQQSIKLDPSFENTQQYLNSNRNYNLIQSGLDTSLAAYKKAQSKAEARREARVKNKESSTNWIKKMIDKTRKNIAANGITHTPELVTPVKMKDNSINSRLNGGHNNG